VVLGFVAKTNQKNRSKPSIMQIGYPHLPHLIAPMILSQWFRSAHVPPELQRWRERILTQLLWITLLIGSVPAMASMLNELQRGMLLPLIVTLGAMIVLIFLSAARQLNYQVRIYSFLSIALSYGVFTLFETGLLGSGRLYVLLTIFLAAVLLPRREALLITVLTSTLTLVILGGMAIGLLPIHDQMVALVTDPIIYLIHTLTLFWFIVAVGGAVLALISQLSMVLSEKDTILTDLAQLNARLEQLVEARTEELQRSQRLLQAVLDNSPVSIYVKDLDGRYLLTNRYMQQVQNQQITTKDGQQEPTHLSTVMAAWRVHEQQVLATGAPVVAEVDAPYADGTHTYYEITFPLRDSTGVINAIGGIATDITERKQVEAALARQLRYTEALARCSQLLLVEGATVDTWEPIVQQALTNLRSAIGCTRLGLNIRPLVQGAVNAHVINVAAHDPEHPFQLIPINYAEVPPKLSQQIRQGEIIVGTVDDLLPLGSSPHTYFAQNGLQNLLLNGIYIYGTYRGFLVASDQRRDFVWDAQIVQVLRTGIEIITAFIQQWETASALRSREAQLRAVGDNFPNGFIYQLHHDAAMQGTFTYLSSGVERVFGVALEDALADASTIDRLVVPEDVLRADQAMLESRLQGSDFKQIIRHRVHTGDIRWIYFCSRPRPTLNGGTIWDGVALDVTEQQQATEALAQALEAAESATEAKSTFLATMSHEMRTPLNAVIGAAALLQETPLTTEQRLLTDTIRTGGKALLTVISDILDFSRIESGRLELEAIPFDLRTCLQAAIDLIAHEAHAKGLALTWQIAPSLPERVIGDEGRLLQVVLNLLSNAVKFTPQGSVTLSAHAQPHDATMVQLTLTVADTGIGMDAEQRERVFAPFVQADSSTARRYGGTGLGLAICQQLVTLMGGTITLTSALDVGSTFVVVLPLRVAALPAAPTSLPLVQSSRPLQVLVAEDNLINQEIIRQMLESQGHSVMLVAHGEAAIEALVRKRYDLVLMDVQMPVLDGVAATQAIRARGGEIHQPYIIALTANAVTGERERLLASGMNDYLTKPMLPEDLRAAIAHMRGEPPEAATTSLYGTMLDQFAAMLGKDRASALATVLELLDTTIPHEIAALQAAMAHDDPVQIQKIAHRLRGGCLQIGAQALAELCQQIETAAPAQRAALSAQLDAVYAATRAEIAAQ
jgi:PAS domain S-box-containing protein